ncbi:DENN domain containing pinstripe isoform X3 [Rhodnius prolixus]|uniref:DENN domain containing pinstripe isoform X3 n=1 Tax=Rhodnius prolixus TaxID=13249 RepID=UPI003D18D7FD
MDADNVNVTNCRTRFADYFVICGLDLSSGLEPDNFAGDHLRTPLERSYKCKVLGHYPESVPSNPFDKDAVGMLCLPNGLQFRTQKSSLEPRFHSFVITKENGKRTYGASYVFFEETRNRKICSAMQTLQAMHLTEVSSTRSRRPLDHSTRSLPRHFKLSAHHNKAAQSYYDHTKDTLYVSKSIALILQTPYVHAAHTFLAGLYRCWKDDGSPSIEANVQNVLYEVYVPAPGRSLSFTCYPCERVILQTPTSLEELPFFDFSLSQLFSLLGVDCVLQLYTCLLLEGQILFCSSDYQRLMLVAESLTTLLFPFTWPHVYVPILPSSCKHFLDAPLPFVMGLHTSESTIDIPPETNLCFIDLDSRSLQTPEELPSFPHRTEFIAEICDVLRRHKVAAENLDLNLNTAGENLMSSSCISMKTRKQSWADTLEDDPSLTHGSETLQRIVSLTRRAGASLDGLDDLDTSWDSAPDDGFSEEPEVSSEAQYLRDLRVNSAIREIFLNRFVHLFIDYDHFIIQPNQDKEEWLNNRESMYNFDKATFLSDQQQQHLPFLSRFIETQMFATLIDNKILSNWDRTETNLRIFDRRIKLLRKRYGCDTFARSGVYECCDSLRDCLLYLEKRINNIDSEVPAPCNSLLWRSGEAKRTTSARSTTFPIIDRSVIREHTAYRNKKRSQQQANRMTSSLTSLSFEESDFTMCCANDDSKLGTNTSEIGNGAVVPHPAYNTSSLRRRSEARPLGGRERLAAVPPKTEPSAALIAQTNWNFVEKLLKDCKQKTKRMLVEKLGSEAVEMGHCAQTSLVEENTLIASLCELLERVWSHGLQKRQGKSALWAHLSNYLEIEECNDSINKPVDQNFVSPDLSSGSLETSPQSGQDGKQQSIRSRSETRTSNTRRLSEDQRQQPTLRALPNTLAYDLRSVQAMTDIKTHIGYARAFIRLSLEKKLLSRHLRTLLSETTLLRTLYKRYAFLRCEEEKEQFLYHLLTLNAVDYSCFTHTYLNTRVPYRVAIFPSRKNSFSWTSANCWVAISGTHGETQRVPVPKGALEFVFHNKNVGLLTTLRIGHDNSGLSPKWLVDNIVVRNEVTGHTYNFPCGRWLGKGIDDDSTERLLVGEREKDGDRPSRAGGEGSRIRSPSVPPPKKVLPLSDIQHMLGDSANSLVKYLYRTSNNEASGTLTVLLCGDIGLVPALEQAFLHGFKSTRLFGRNLYIWEYIVKVKEESESLVTKSDTLRYFNNLVEAISHCGNTLGKDGRFQVFVCLALRDHMLAEILVGVFAISRTTADLFEEESFLRDPNLLTYIVHIVQSLDQYSLVLEKSLTHGIVTNY